ncbi:MAG: hypothetical protein ACRCW1_05840 [Anaerotignaceae bacterium]
MNKDYLTVKELSEKVGISTQAIYKRLQTDFKPYLQDVKGKKCLNIKVLELFEQQEVATELQTILQPIVNLLQQQNEQLQNELAIKNKQIEELNLRLAEAHRMTEQAHYLQGAEKIEKIADSSSSELMQEQEPTKQSKSFLSKLFKK